MATEEIICPNCNHKATSQKSIGLPDDTVATCKGCGLRFSLGMSRRLMPVPPTPPPTPPPAPSTRPVDDRVTVSTVDVPYRQTIATQVVVEHRENTLGTAAFVTSIVALLTLGCLSPIALVLSLIAVTKKPRGMAAAGIVLSCVGLLPFGFFASMLLVGSAVNDAVAARKVKIASELDKLHITIDSIYIRKTQFGSEPAVKATLINNSDRAFGALQIAVEVRQPNRSVALATGKAIASIDGGIEPGETKQVEFDASDIHGLRDLPDGYVATAEVIAAKDANEKWLMKPEAG